MTTLGDYRAQIDVIDEEISAALERRVAIVRDVAAMKRRNGTALRDLVREGEVVRGYASRAVLIEPERAAEFGQQVLHVTQAGSCGTEQVEKLVASVANAEA